MAERELTPAELRQRKRELDERKYSFIELIMQIRKKMHKEKWDREHGLTHENQEEREEHRAQC